jgi:hypothetical protein
VNARPFFQHVARPRCAAETSIALEVRELVRAPVVLVELVEVHPLARPSPSACQQDRTHCQVCELAVEASNLSRGVSFVASSAVSIRASVRVFLSVVLCEGTLGNVLSLRLAGFPDLLCALCPPSAAFVLAVVAPSGQLDSRTAMPCRPVGTVKGFLVRPIFCFLAFPLHTRLFRCVVQYFLLGLHEFT